MMILQNNEAQKSCDIPFKGVGQSGLQKREAGGEGFVKVSLKFEI